jgi:hypothetical protein
MNAPPIILRGMWVSSPYLCLVAAAGCHSQIGAAFAGAFSARCALRFFRGDRAAGLAADGIGHRRWFADERPDAIIPKPTYRFFVTGAAAGWIVARSGTP